MLWRLCRIYLQTELLLKCASSLRLSNMCFCTAGTISNFWTSLHTDYVAAALSSGRSTAGRMLDANPERSLSTSYLRRRRQFCYCLAFGESFGESCEDHPGAPRERRDDSKSSTRTPALSGSPRVRTAHGRSKTMPLTARSFGLPNLFRRTGRMYLLICRSGFSFDQPAGRPCRIGPLRRPVFWATSSD